MQQILCAFNKVVIDCTKVKAWNAASSRQSANRTGGQTDRWTSWPVEQLNWQRVRMRVQVRVRMRMSTLLIEVLAAHNSHYPRRSGTKRKCSLIAQFTRQTAKMKLKMKQEEKQMKKKMATSKCFKYFWCIECEWVREEAAKLSWLTFYVFLMKANFKRTTRNRSHCTAHFCPAAALLVGAHKNC